MGLAAVRDMREARVPAGPEAAEALETDVLAGFVLARAAAGLSDRTISADVSNQNIWRQLAGQLGRICDPAALPGWLAATTRRECGKVRRAAPTPQPARSLPDTGHIPDEQTGMTERELRKPARTRRSARRSPACRPAASS